MNKASSYSLYKKRSDMFWFLLLILSNFDSIFFLFNSLFFTAKTSRLGSTTLDILNWTIVFMLVHSICVVQKYWQYSVRVLHFWVNPQVNRLIQLTFLSLCVSIMLSWFRSFKMINIDAKCLTRYLICKPNSKEKWFWSWGCNTSSNMFNFYKK